MLTMVLGWIVELVEMLRAAWRGISQAAVIAAQVDALRERTLIALADAWTLHNTAAARARGGVN